MQELKVLDLALGTIDTRITAAVKKTGGTLDEKVEKNLSAAIVRTPVAECTRLAERNKIQVERDPETPGYYNCFFESTGGWMEIHGPQFDLDRLKKATRVRIDGNMEFTSITPESGEFTGTFEKGADNNEKVFFRTRCVAKIWRSHAQVGGRLVVAVMVSYPDGQRRNYQYLEGQTGVDAGAGATTPIDGRAAERRDRRPTPGRRGRRRSTGATTPAPTAATPTAARRLERRRQRFRLRRLELLGARRHFRKHTNARRRNPPKTTRKTEMKNRFHTAFAATALLALGFAAAPAFADSAADKVTGYVEIARSVFGGDKTAGDVVSATRSPAPTRASSASSPRPSPPPRSPRTIPPSPTRSRASSPR